MEIEDWQILIFIAAIIFGLWIVCGVIATSPGDYPPYPTPEMEH